jgi:hypothetical protein
MKHSTTQFLTWLQRAQPAFYNKIAHRLPPGGLHGLGDTTGDSSILGDITGALNSITTAIGTVASDKALISTNLSRAQQGLSPVSTLPPTIPASVTGALSSPWVWLGLAATALGGWMLLKPKKRK